MDHRLLSRTTPVRMITRAPHLSSGRLPIIPTAACTLAVPALPGPVPWRSVEEPLPGGRLARRHPPPPAGDEAHGQPLRGRDPRTMVGPSDSNPAFYRGRGLVSVPPVGNQLVGTWPRAGKSWPASRPPARRRTSSRCSTVKGLTGSSGFLPRRRPRRGCCKRGRSGVGSGARLRSISGSDGFDVNSGPGVKSDRPGTGPEAPGITV